MRLDTHEHSFRSATSELIVRLTQFLNLAGEYFLQGPSSRLEKLLADPEWVRSLRECGLVGSSPPVGSADPDVHRREFEELLRIPGARFVPPFEQAYRDAETSPEHSATIACRSIYAAAGYEMSPFRHAQPDHIGHQLRFLAALGEREVTCLERGDAEAAVRVGTWRQGFVREHCTWWGEFVGRLASASSCPQVVLMATLAGTLEGILSRLSLD